MTTQNSAPNSAAHTPLRRFRVPDGLWEAYGSVCARLDTDRSADLLAHIAAVIQAYGDDGELAALERARAELAERRSRRGGRPRKTPGPE
ncbi:hypothetical protein [Spongiactinospora sp. TRM90649]|uniref:hypothetical protein n=1 Tax=Spongiactinospora sp. TRM90649 TaxID=3031114 RepID=UPI0023F6BE95|nr:hypothetical protein [Spongiactinospora sp. TRM90649]MDF5758350.1 hypothetical protein [Spongiactinospora sp. TRM90649]